MWDDKRRSHVMENARAIPAKRFAKFADGKNKPGQRDLDAHEEHVVLRVHVLLEVDNVSAAGADERRHSATMPLRSGQEIRRMADSFFTAMVRILRNPRGSRQPGFYAKGL